jgi:hypothetical protein
MASIYRNTKNTRLSTRCSGVAQGEALEGTEELSVKVVVKLPISDQQQRCYRLWRLYGGLLCGYLKPISIVSVFYMAAAGPVSQLGSGGPTQRGVRYKINVGLDV